MGSSKLQVKNKSKFKKLKKFQNLRKIRRSKFSTPKLCKDAHFVKTLSGIKDIFNYRLFDQKIYSRSYAHDHDIPKMKKLAQVREQYLSYLRTVIKNNCANYGSPVAQGVLDSLSLKLEQHALLSSLQIDVYENFLKKIINDIEKCTKERQIHNEVKNLLPGSKEAVINNKFNANSPESESSLQTITISDSSDDNLNENEINLANQSVFNSGALDQCPRDSQQYSVSYTVPQDSDELSSLSDIRANDEYDTVSNDSSNFTRREPKGSIELNDDYHRVSNDKSNFVRKEAGGINRADNDYNTVSNNNSYFTGKEPEGTTTANNDNTTVSNCNSYFTRKEPEGTIRASHDYGAVSSYISNFTRKEPEGTTRANQDSTKVSHYISYFARKEPGGTTRVNNDNATVSDYNSYFTRKEPEGTTRTNNDCATVSDYNSYFTRKEPAGTTRVNNDNATVSNYNSYLTRKEPELNEVEILQVSPSTREAYSPSQNDFSNKTEGLNTVPLSSEKLVDNKTLDTFTECSKVMEKCMEQIFSLDEISDEFLENARAHIIQLLEDENFHSEGEGERAEKEQEGNEKRNEDEKVNEAQLESENERNFARRLEKMRPFFNMDERRQTRKMPINSKKSRKSKPNKNKEAKRQLRRMTAWKNEKVIQQYKVSTLTSQLSYEKREEMGKLFVRLFGKDSDEEHEFEYGSTYQFKTSCIERISSWVVKHLTPFYDKRRIISRRVFKSLGHRISQAIIDKIQYPDERTVKYFVQKFFPPNKRYGFQSKRNRR